MEAARVRTMVKSLAAQYWAVGKLHQETTGSLRTGAPEANAMTTSEALYHLENFDLTRNTPKTGPWPRPLPRRSKKRPTG